MNRRELVAALGAAAIFPLPARAQKTPVRIGLVVAGAETTRNAIDGVAALKQGLAENHLIEGRDYILDTRFAAGAYELFPGMMRDLARAGTRVILANTIASVRAAQGL